MSRTFQQLKESQYASDYLVNKKASLLYCKNRKCNIECKPVWNEGDYLLNKKAQNKYNNVVLGTTFNTKELYGGLITKENVRGVPVLQNAVTLKSPTSISSSSEPFYQTYTIDPKGLLFGNTPCGVNNFVQFMEPI